MFHVHCTKRVWCVTTVVGLSGGVARATMGGVVVVVMDAGVVITVVVLVEEKMSAQTVGTHIKRLNPVSGYSHSTC